MCHDKKALQIRRFKKIVISFYITPVQKIEYTLTMEGTRDSC